MRGRIRDVMATLHATVVADVRFAVPLYSSREAAGYLGVPATTFASWVKGYRRDFAHRAPVEGAPLVTGLPPEVPGGPTIPLAPVTSSDVRPGREHETTAARADPELLTQLTAWVDGQLGLADLGYKGEVDALRIPIKKTAGSDLSCDQQAYNAVHGGLRALGERANSLLKIAFKALRRWRGCPWRSASSSPPHSCCSTTSTTATMASSQVLGLLPARAHGLLHRRKIRLTAATDISRDRHGARCWRAP
jgi:hypothetical protein